MNDVTPTSKMKQMISLSVESNENLQWLEETFICQDNHMFINFILLLYFDAQKKGTIRIVQ